MVVSRYLKFLFFYWAFPSIAFADVNFLPRAATDLESPEEEALVQVADTELAYINYEALLRDFPDLNGKSKSEMNSWVLKNFSYLSEEQLRLSHIRNTVVPLVQPIQKKIGYRPPGWGRAVVIPALNEMGKQIGLVDVKGAGIRPGVSKVQVESYLNVLKEPTLLFSSGFISPSRKMITSKDNHGTMSFPEAISEVFKQETSQALFDIYNFNNHGTSSFRRLESIESYFIIVLPFERIRKEGSLRLALYGRQPHFGRMSGLEIPSPIYVDHTGGSQGDYFGNSVDYGHVVISDPRFQKTLGLINLFVKQASRTEAPYTFAFVRALEVANEVLMNPKRNTYLIQEHISQILEPIQDLRNEAKSRLKKVERVSFQKAIEMGLNSPKGDLQVGAIYALRSLPSDRVPFDVVVDALKKSNEKVQEAAVITLKNFKDLSILPEVLLSRINDELSKSEYGRLKRLFQAKSTDLDEDSLEVDQGKRDQTHNPDSRNPDTHNLDINAAISKYFSCDPYSQVDIKTIFIRP